MTANLPVVGAAMNLSTLEKLHDWVCEQDRDLELQDFISVELLEGDWRPVVARAKELLDGHQGRVGIHGPFWGFTIDSQDSAIREVVQRRLMQGLDVCEALGGTHMVVHSPFTSWGNRNARNSAGQVEKQIERSRATLMDAVKKAEDIGCTLVIENIDDIDPLSRVELARSFESDAVAVSLDTGHGFYAHRSNGAPPLDYFIDAAGPLLAHIHLQDADGYADRHWAIGDGTVPWWPVFKAIAATGANPRLILELRDADRILDSANWLSAQGLVR